MTANDKAQQSSAVQSACQRPAKKNRVNKANNKTPAARFNTKVFLGLERKLRENPEADITTLLTSSYSKTLQDFQIPLSGSMPDLPRHDIRSRLCEDDPCAIVSKLSTDLERILGYNGDGDGDGNGNGLAVATMTLLSHPDTEVIYEGPWAASVMVFRVDEGIVAKVTPQQYLQTEYRTLAYLEEHLPTFPAPRLHGVVQLGIYYVMFTELVPGMDLEKAWPQLDDGQKQDISRQLDTLFSELRSLPFPADTPLGGVGGQGCKDARRGIRVSSGPVTNAKQFEDFVFGVTKMATALYTSFLRHLLPPSPKIVFTHGDLRPANIMVRQDESGSWAVAAIIDWDAGGFYPEYWESIKMTNNLTCRDTFDWYKFLPETLSCHTYPVQWLVDRIWDPIADNS